MYLLDRGDKSYYADTHFLILNGLEPCNLEHKENRLGCTCSSSFHPRVWLVLLLRSIFAKPFRFILLSRQKGLRAKHSKHGVKTKSPLSPVSLCRSHGNLKAGQEPNKVIWPAVYILFWILGFLFLILGVSFPIFEHLHRFIWLSP